MGVETEVWKLRSLDQLSNPGIQVKVHPVRTRDTLSPQGIEGQIKNFIDNYRIECFYPMVVETNSGTTTFQTDNQNRLINSRIQILQSFLRGDIGMDRYYEFGRSILGEIWARDALRLAISKSGERPFEVRLAPSKLDHSDPNFRDLVRAMDIVMLQYTDKGIQPVVGIDVTTSRNTNNLSRKRVGSMDELCIPVLVLRLDDLRFKTEGGKRAGIIEYLSDVRFAIRRGEYAEFVAWSISTDTKIIKKLLSRLRDQCRLLRDKVVCREIRPQYFNTVDYRATLAERAFS